MFFSDGGVYGDHFAGRRGREGVIKVVRVHTADALNPSMYRIYIKMRQGMYRGSFFASWFLQKTTCCR